MRFVIDKGRGRMMTAVRCMTRRGGIRLTIEVFRTDLDTPPSRTGGADESVALNVRFHHHRYRAASDVG
jgi:hypothetical protein